MSEPTGAHHRSADESFVPSESQIDELITRAQAHPLGLEFLKEGSLDSVAAIFEVHAFVVDRAREQLDA